MARAAHSPLPQPVFHEPIFGEDGSLPDPNGFSTTHPSDGALYNEIGDLLKKDVVAVPPSRLGADQFYEPFRNYPAPIFAIPGNHDSFVVPGTADGHKPLDTFQRNFCATQHVITPEAGSLHRTAMTQPGVYFTLDAPFVRIIGLFSNSLEDPCVISNVDHKWDAVSNVQIEFLRAQLRRIKQE